MMDAVGYRDGMRSVARIAVAVGMVVLAIWLVIAQPGCSTQTPVSISVPTDRLEQHVQRLSGSFHPRSWRHAANLDRCADYVRGELVEAGAVVRDQVYEVRGMTFRNVIGRFGPEKGDLLVVGAHYDAYESTPGADDNASGIAVLLELARLLGTRPPARPVELVAFTLEEPPFFRTEHMGSARYAAELKASNQPVAGVIILEMVGYFTDAPFSQRYPSPLLWLMYPSRGNFLAVVGRFDQGRWISKVKRGMAGTTPLPIHSIRAPTALPGIDFSDHLNFWAQGYPAVMLTDTAFYRNTAYHTADDTVDRLDLRRMAEVTTAVAAFIHAP